MLVLSRKPNEAVFFPGTQTRVQVLSSRRGEVRLGIEAPPEVTIWREASASMSFETAAGAPENARLPIPQSDSLIQTLGMGLGLARLQIETGHAEDAQETLKRLHIEIQQVGHKFGKKPGASRVGESSSEIQDTADDEEADLLAACCH